MTMDEFWDNEPSIPVEELIRQRLDLLTNKDPDLHVQDTRYEGSSAYAYDCTYGTDAKPKMLKVSKMREGIARNETDAFSYLQDVVGIPQLFKDYRSEQYPDRTIAILTEKILGSSIEEHIEANPKTAFAVVMKLHAVIKGVHSRGFRMPFDWLKQDNWIVTADGQPYLIDLGEAQRAGNSLAEEVQGYSSDLRGFNTIVDKYLSKMGWWDKRKIRNLLYNEYMRLNQMENP